MLRMGGCTWMGGNKPPKGKRLPRLWIECGYELFSRWERRNPYLRPIFLHSYLVQPNS